MKLTRRPLIADVPTSSMADIAFLLIVFFMVTTVFSSNAGLTFFSPKSETGDEPDPAVLIHLKPGGAFALDGLDYGPAELSRVFGYVHGKVQVNPAKPIILLTEPDTEYGRMIAVLDELKKVEKTLKGPALSITIPTKAEARILREAL